MKRIILFYTLVFLELWGCSENEVALINFIEVESVLQGDQGSFLMNYEPQYIGLTEESLIYGRATRDFNQFVFFTSHSELREVHLLNSLSISNNSTLVYHSSDTIIYQVEDGNSLSIIRSVNNQDFQKLIQFTLTENTERLYPSTAAFINGNKGWFLTSNYVGFDIKMNTYEINKDRVTKISEKIIESGRFYRHNLYVTSTGFFITLSLNYSNEVTVMTSHDYGNSWTDEIISESDITGGFQLIDQDFFVSKRRSGEIMISIDGAVSWDNIASNLTEVNDVRFISKKVGFLINRIDNDRYGDIVDFYETRDGGLSWDKKNSLPFYGEAFSINQNGVVVSYTDDVIQISKDSGYSWELISIDP